MATRPPVYLNNVLFNSLYAGGEGETLACTDVSASVAIPGAGSGANSPNMIQVFNAGNNPVSVRLGGSDVVATAKSYPIPVAGYVFLPLQPGKGVTGSLTYIAGICGSGLTATLVVTPGIANFQ